MADLQNIKLIPLTQGKHAVVDADNYELLMQWKWHFSSHGYAARTIWLDKDNRKIMYMHRFILEAACALEIDHINGNGLDNRRCNLRLVTKAQNAMNVKRRKVNCSSRYKGVSLEKRTNKWKAYLTLSQKQIGLGNFKTEQEAALSYNEAAKKYFGEYAKINEISYE